MSFAPLTQRNAPHRQKSKVHLVSLDESLLRAVENMSVRLLHVDAVHEMTQIMRRQDLEAYERERVNVAIFMTPQQAAKQLRKCNRSIGFLTYGCM